MNPACFSPRCLGRRLGFSRPLTPAPSTAARRDLAEFLKSAFTDVGHLKIFLRQRTAEDVVDSLPDSLSLKEYADRAVDELVTRRLVDGALFEALRQERPNAGPEIDRLSAVWAPRKETDPCEGCPAPWGWIVGLVGLVGLGIAAGFWHPDPVAKDGPIAWMTVEEAEIQELKARNPPRPAAERVPPVAVTVVLLDGPVPAHQDAPGEVAAAVAAVAAEHPRAILLDIFFPKDGSDYTKLEAAVAAARKEGIPVMAARPEDGDRKSGISACFLDSSAEWCFDDLLHAEIPAGAAEHQSVEAWDACRTRSGSQRRTFGFAAAELATGSWERLAAAWAAPTGCPEAPVPMPDVSDACMRPYDVIGVSELGSAPRAPAAAGRCARLSRACPSGASPLAGRVALVGDARAHGEAGADILSVGPNGGVCAPGAEVHAAAAAAFARGAR